MRRFVAFGGLALFVLASSPVQAASLLDQARERATVTQLQWVRQPVGGALAARAGAEDGRQRQGAADWFLGGLLLAVIMPILAHVSTPQPAAAALQFTDDDARCYSAAYSDAAASKRKKARGSVRRSCSGSSSFPPRRVRTTCPDVDLSSDGRPFCSWASLLVVGRLDRFQTSSTSKSVRRDQVCDCRILLLRPRVLAVGGGPQSGPM